MNTLLNIVFIPLVLFEVFSCCCLYNWFLLPITGYQINYSTMFGITLFIAVMMGHYNGFDHLNADQDDRTEYRTNMYLDTFGRCVCGLITGIIINGLKYI